ncbi:MAG: thioredoxin domain-containing protein [Cyclobacteriaceae bacterium]
MKSIVLLIVFLFSMGACTTGQVKGALTANEFANKLKEQPTAQLVDVRTAGEFSKGHIHNALNIDLYKSTFEQEVASLDKTKPVLVYCLSGSRSAEAAALMRANGFEEVYDLKGGLLKWTGANLPTTSELSVKSSGMSLQDFNALIVHDKIVLIDFYADWCGPCKKMEPYLKEISRDMADRVELVRINTDDNQQLISQLKIDAIPVLQVYKNKQLTWTNTGYIGKEEVLKQLQ